MKRPYTEGVEKTTVTLEAWRCTTCGATHIAYPKEIKDAPDPNYRAATYAELRARGCCAKAFPCPGCGALASERAHWFCGACVKSKDDARHAKRERRPWKGEPIGEDDGERYFMDGDVDELLDAYPTEAALRDAHLVFAKPHHARPFDVSEYHDDCLPDDCDVDRLFAPVMPQVEALNKALAALGPVSWVVGDVAVDEAPLWAEMHARLLEDEERQGGVP